MEAVRCHAVLEKEGEITLTGLPYHVGQGLEVIVLPDVAERRPGKGLTARELLESGLVGMWKDRADIADTGQFARTLREQAWDRTG